MTDVTIRLFSTDLDGTLLGEEEACKQFYTTWTNLDPKDKPRLCYNTGRMHENVLELIATKVLPAPDFIISGVGTSVYDYKAGQILKEFAEMLDEDWDIDAVVQIITEFPAEIKLQAAHYQNEYKSSWYFADASSQQIDELKAQLEKASLNVHVVYSSGLHLDILPRWANKGNALRWLIKHLDYRNSEVLVAGDSGNDSAMFALKDIHGIIVGNAQPELIELTQQGSYYFAPAHEICAYAVLSGLRKFKVIDEASESRIVDSVPLSESIRVSTEVEIEHLTKDEVAFIRQGYHKAIDALRKNITPSGFSACSLDDNEVLGTDENYRSVWARDGALSVIGSLPLLEDHEDFHECQRQTLITLTENISPGGHIPANVRIDDLRPDYSGVGGIASIDSGLWLIIAFYEYVARTRDYDFLRTHQKSLQRAMDWLSAHDSNNDALLEIPEAGDWTDLFGRSYNVLYDEVLWYRCNVCFGRLLQMLGEEQKGGDYLRWARIIKREILLNFWPTTQLNISNPRSFSEQQYSIGDARYLLAEITPFNFSWRCDTLGNMLAFLYGVVDSKKASQTFRFMWGVGVNDPYPVANLYPSVMGGDSDWRPYYAVNLLNLPHQYHNGGIWPFVGGHWVRYINKLGLRELALRELHHLTELNKLGVQQEWEFNEWAHGQTGRPMGKAFQAWSASEFIRACHALHVIA